MAKMGTAYERVVAEVFDAMESNATVETGQWIEGPDGRRDLDVVISGIVKNRPYRVVIECKDYNPDSTGPVGIELIDALDSKRHDLGVDFAVICSNGGFTKGALKKAGRVGIGAISVLKMGDRRVRFAVQEQLYTRQVKVESLEVSIRFEQSFQSSGVALEAVRLGGKPVVNWVIGRIQLFFEENPVVNGAFSATHDLKKSVDMELPSETRKAVGIDYRMTISGNWHVQDITVDSTGAIYDWLRRRIRLMPGEGQLVLQGGDVYAGRIVKKPPEWVLSQGYRPEETGVNVILIEGLGTPGDAPDIDHLIKESDLDYKMSELGEDMVSSVDT